MEITLILNAFIIWNFKKFFVKLVYRMLIRTDYDYVQIMILN